MDGATKFVKGDAVAALVIIVVNIVGGLTDRRSCRSGLDIGDALTTTYTVLTVGDGLVNEISALLVSVATGILVTRERLGEGPRHRPRHASCSARPKLFMVVGGVLIAIGLVPGLPDAHVLRIAGGSSRASAGSSSQRRRPPRSSAPMRPSARGAPRCPLSAAASARSTRSASRRWSSRSATASSVSWRAARTGGLVERIGLIRRQIASGARPDRPDGPDPRRPGPRPDSYVIKLRGAEIARGSVDPHRLLCMDPTGGEIAVDGIPTTEPVFGLPAAWISIADRERAEAMGYTVVDAASVARDPPLGDDPAPRPRDPRPPGDQPAARCPQARPARASSRRSSRTWSSASATSRRSSRACSASAIPIRDLSHDPRGGRRRGPHDQGAALPHRGRPPRAGPQRSRAVPRPRRRDPRRRPRARRSTPASARSVMVQPGLRRASSSPGADRPAARRGDRPRLRPNAGSASGISRSSSARPGSGWLSGT